MTREAAVWPRSQSAPLLALLIKGMEPGRRFTEGSGSSLTRAQRSQAPEQLNGGSAGLFADLARPDNRSPGALKKRRLRAGQNRRPAAEPGRDRRAASLRGRGGT